MRRHSVQLQSVATVGVAGSVSLTAPQWQEPWCIGVGFEVAREPARVIIAMTNVRVEAGPTARRQARVGENVQRTTDPGLVACRWASPRTRGLGVIVAMLVRTS